jgi:hypothetical protein
VVLLQVTSACTKLLFSSLLLQILRACTRQVFGAITFNSAAPKWDYAIREYTVMMPEGCVGGGWGWLWRNCLLCCTLLCFTVAVTGTGLVHPCRSQLHHDRASDPGQ